MPLAEIDYVNILDFPSLAPVSKIEKSFGCCSCKIRENKID